MSGLDERSHHGVGPRLHLEETGWSDKEGARARTEEGEMVSPTGFERFCTVKIQGVVRAA